MTDPRSSRAVGLGYGLVNLMLVVGVVFAAFEIVNAATAAARGGHFLVGGRTLTVHAELNPEQVSLPEGVHLRSWPRVALEVKNPSSAQIGLSTAMEVLPVALFFAGLWLLRGIARSVREGDPFGADNVRRLRGIGFVLVVGAPVLELVSSSLRTALYNRLPAGKFGDIGVSGFNPPATALVIGLGAFILAEVFAHGLRLREDVEATI